MLQKFNYTYKEWFVAKLCTAILWLFPVVTVVYKYKAQPFPDSICRLVNCSVITQQPYVYLATGMAVILAILYVFEKWMPFTLFLISVLSIVVFSLESSNGTHASRNELLCMVFIAQLIAYIRYNFSGQKTKSATSPFAIAMFYSIQVIAAAYVITAITKLNTSGFNWVLNAPSFAVRVIRPYNSMAIDFNNPALIEKGHHIANVILQHSALIKFLFALVFATELFAFISVFSKRNAKYYSILLLLLHLGIFILFGGVIINFAALTLIYLTNIPSFFIKQQAESSRQSENFSFKNLAADIYALSFCWLFIISSYIIGDHTPFSTYAMFSSAINSTDYFFVTDKRDTIITPLLKMRTVEVKDMVYAVAIKSGLDVNNDRALQTIGGEALQQIISRNQNNPELFQLDSLKLYRHKIEIKNEAIKEENILLGAIQVQIHK